MPTDFEIAEISELSDPRLAAYHGLRTSNWTRFSGRFIAEGQTLVERMIETGQPIESILCERAHLVRLLEFLKRYASPGSETAYCNSSALADSPRFVIYVVPDQSASDLVGFQFHRGVIGCGRRQEPPLIGSDLEPLLQERSTWVGMIGVQDPENFGTILRTCAGLGVDTVLLGPNSCDPFSRRVLRTSMGTVWRLRLLQCPDPVRTLTQLQSKHQMQVIATSLADGSQPLVKSRLAKRVLMLLGNERHGLPVEVENLADLKLRIDMDLNVDSLNVSVAAGIVLHYIARVAARGSLE